jgi:hypothetical protein
MAIRALITALFLLAGSFVTVPSVSLAASPADLCLSGHAPAGWLRPGGYCDIAADLNLHSGIEQGGGGASCKLVTHYGCGRYVFTFTDHGNTFDVYKVSGGLLIGLKV